MRIYIAGASVEVDMVQRYRDRLLAAGHVITHDWTKHVVASQRAGVSDAALSEPERARHAAQDLAGVDSAEVLWLIVPPRGRSAGAWVEFGYAIGKSDHVMPAWRPLIVASGDRYSIFTSHADREFATHDDALRFLLQMRTVSQ